MGSVIKDFYKSDAPQFKGRSKEKRREMAIAAKLEAERGPQNEGMSPKEIMLQKKKAMIDQKIARDRNCLLYTSPSPRDATLSRMPSSA